MSIKSSKPCTYPGCAHFATSGGRCEIHQREFKKKYDINRDSTQEWRKWIHSTRYRKAIGEFKKSHPLCERCLKEGKITPVYIIHHKIPHEGDYERFWDVDNWESICTYHHELEHRDGRFGNDRRRSK